MFKNQLNIGIVEKSDLLFEGLTNILLKHKMFIRFYRMDDFEECQRHLSLTTFDIIMINPLQVQNRLKQFIFLKREFPNIQWVALVYTLFNSEIMQHFDAVIEIDENHEAIFKKVDKLTLLNSKELSNGQETLSDRELDVLKQLSVGLSNKEIANQLNISIHTVISHRKNITQKTGIKSQSGLTIYAISNNIISIDNL